MDETSFPDTEANLAKSPLRVKLMRRLNYFLSVHPFKGSGIISGILAKLPAFTAKGPALVSTRYGFDLICRDPIHDRGVERALYLTGSYEAGTLDVMRASLRKGDTFIDVGANIGVMSLFASKIVGEDGAVYSFEPEPETFMILTENIRMNKVGNVHAHNIGLGDSKGQSLIYTNPFAGRGSASLVRPLGQDTARAYEIRVETLDGLVASNNLSGVRMLKIDVEGWELHVLKGAESLLRSAAAPIICIEYSELVATDSGRRVDIYDYILSLNSYSIYKLEHGKGTPSKLVKVSEAGGLPHHDNLFCFLPWHLSGLPRNLFGPDDSRPGHLAPALRG